MGRKIARSDSTVARLLHGVNGLLGKYAVIEAAGAPALDLDEDERVFLGIASDDVGFAMLASIVRSRMTKPGAPQGTGDSDKLTELADLLLKEYSDRSSSANGSLGRTLDRMQLFKDRDSLRSLMAKESLACAHRRCSHRFEQKGARENEEGCGEIEQREVDGPIRPWHTEACTRTASRSLESSHRNSHDESGKARAPGSRRYARRTRSPSIGRDGSRGTRRLARP